MKFWVTHEGHEAEVEFHVEGDRLWLEVEGKRVEADARRLPDGEVYSLLIAGRSHDLGWPGWPIVMLYTIPMAPFLIWFDEATGAFGGSLAQLSVIVPPDVQEVLVFVPIAVFWMAMLGLATIPGQKDVNSFGAQPSPGI